MTKTAAAHIGLVLWAWVLCLLALPLALLALVSVEKLFRGTHMNHLVLEILLIVGAGVGLPAPAVFIIRREKTWQLRALSLCSLAVGVAIAALFSPLFRGFVH